MTLSVPVRARGRWPRQVGAVTLLVVWWLLLACAPAAETPATTTAGDPLIGLSSDDAEVRKAAIAAIGQSHDMRLVAFLDDFQGGGVFRWKDRIVLAPRKEADAQASLPTPLLDPYTREPLSADGHPLVVDTGELTEVAPSRKERTLVRDALTLLRLSDPDRQRRIAAVIKAGDGGNALNLPPLKLLLEGETDERVRVAINESILIIELTQLTAATGAQNTADRIITIAKLGNLRSSRALGRIKEIAANDKDPQVVAACATAVAAIENWQGFSRGIGHVFSGLSQGSILVLMALGLSIIFGLMGVINMAHGELMMIGAYAAYLTQQVFMRVLPPAAFDWYFPIAIPLSFAAAALIGWLMEVLIIRHLYGRPLETLLATFGVSLLLTQAVRVIFGDNIAVNSPTWLQGGVEIMQDVVLPWNRLFIIGFCITCILLMYWLIERTKLGLLLRATTQNRTMAAALGVATRRVDGYTFALGAGLAGLAGCALTLVGGVTPDMGQNYIVDSFLVVVTGGVGKLAGAIWAGMGLGCLNKMFEPFTEAVWAKVLILAAVVVFMQWRPSGLFPAKGRLADV